METCKVPKRSVASRLTIEDRFGFEPEITAKIASLARENIRIYEVGMPYHGRTYLRERKSA
jgi:hypothetical protein